MNAEGVGYHLFVLVAGVWSAFFASEVFLRWLVRRVGES